MIVRLRRFDRQFMHRGHYRVISVQGYGGFCNFAGGIISWN